MSASPYQYFVLRCVPRVDRGEFVNVGIVLHCDDRDLLLAATKVDPLRLQALDRHLDLDGLRAALLLVHDVCAGRTGGGRPALPTAGKRFGWLAAPRSTILQAGPVHGGLTQDPEGTLEELMNAQVR